MPNKLTSRFAILLILTIASLHAALGQADSARSNPYDSLSLKDLLNVNIVSVSKKTELLFDAPLSASVVTRDDIQKTGCISIMEALRLVPGMIVREESNGNYDIQLRGLGNVPPNAPFDVTSNSTTLVMIDNRQVYSYLRGGTFWETLTIDLNDVERIEVVRGPAAALYGPNAVNGVINIITRQPLKDGLYLVANSRQGSYKSSIHNISAGYRLNKNLNMVASGNYQRRDRTQTSYFEFTRNNWLTRPDYLINFTGDTAFNVGQRYPHPSLALEKYAGNVFLNYDDPGKVKINLATGVQHSLAQRVSTENELTPLSTVASDSRYIDLRAGGRGVSVQLSYNGGVQATDANPGRKYDFSVVSGNIEYAYTKGKFSLKPGLSYTSAVIDDRKYSDLLNKTGLLNGRGQITTTSASLRGEYPLLHNKLRLVAGMATSTFNHPDETYLSYEFAATYKINKKHLLRAVWSKAPRSSNIFDTYVSQTISYFQTGYNNYNRLALEGNDDPKLLTANMFEIGYRSTIAPQLNIDVEVFQISAKNYNIPVVGRSYMQLNGADTINIMPVRSTNLPLELLERGVTISLSWCAKKLQLKPFITIQNTKARDYAPFNNMPDAGYPNAPQNNIYSGIGNEATLKSTPTSFGGGSVNYPIVPNVNISMTAYYYSSQTYYHVANIIFNDGVRGIDHIPAKLIVNASIVYKPVKGLQLSLSGKNLLNDNSREFFKTDNMPFMLFGGLHYDF